MTERTEPDWDPRDPSVLGDQRQAYDEMRARCPVAHSDFVMATDRLHGPAHLEIPKVARTPKGRIRGPRSAIGLSADGEPASPRTMPIPQESGHRRAADRNWFHPLLVNAAGAVWHDGSYRGICRSPLAPRRNSRQACSARDARNTVAGRASRGRRALARRAIPSGTGPAVPAA